MAERKRIWMRIRDGEVVRQLAEQSEQCSDTEGAGKLKPLGADASRAHKPMIVAWTSAFVPSGLKGALNEIRPLTWMSSRLAEKQGST